MRIGIIGRGFGLRVVAPVFDETDGCKVVDVVSPRDVAAVASLCTRKDVDLISVHSPPFLHAEHVRWAIDAGHAVLCDKPFGRNAAEAATMRQMAGDAGAVSLLNFEMRFDPLRERLRALIQDGGIGRPAHLLCTSYMAVTRVPLRHYGWVFDAGLGGGWIGAWGSHVVDFVRWSLGEVEQASAQLRTTIDERPDAEGRLHRCTAADAFTAMLRMVSGATATIEGTSAAPVSLASRTLVVGSEGMLEVTGDRLITRHDEAGAHQEFVSEHGVRDLSIPMRRWASRVRDSVRRGAAEAGAPTFNDGVACRQVLDRLLGAPVDMSPRP